MEKKRQVDSETTERDDERTNRDTSESVSALIEDTEQGGKIIIKSWAGLFKHIEDLTFSSDWKKRAIGDAVMGATGGILISGIAIGFVITIVFPARATIAISVVVSALIVVSYAIGVLSKYKNTGNSE